VISNGSVVFYSASGTHIAQWLRFLNSFFEEVKYCYDYCLFNFSYKDNTITAQYNTDSWGIKKILGIFVGK
jgi:hypothetical protein